MSTDLHVINGEDKAHVPEPVAMAAAHTPLLSEVLVSNPKFTINLKSSGEISLTIRTDNEDELESLLQRWEPLIVIYPDPNESNGHQRHYPGGTCPQCSNKLVRRQGKAGKFLGCVGYPDCKFTSPL